MPDDPVLVAVDQVPFIMAVCEGAELRVLSLSAATRAVLPGREWAGRPIREVISDLIGQQFVDAYYEVYRTGEPMTGQEWRAHLDMPDGSVHEMYANFTITPWQDESGSRRGVIGVGFDVTDMVRQRQAAAAELAKVAADAAAGRALHDPGLLAAERVCGQAVELLVRATGHADDITMLAAQRVTVPAGLSLDPPADPGSLSSARSEIGAWLESIGATDHDAFLLQHALGELIANAIEHASSTVAVRAELTTTGQVEASVRDQGSWRQPERAPNRGRGLALATQLVDSLRVAPSSDGTLARLTHALARPARMLDGQDPAPVRLLSPAATGFRIVEQAGAAELTVRIEGAFDATTAGRAQQELLRHSRGGTVPMSVDLTAVTHLSSAGVSALHHVAGQHAAQSAPLSLRADAGSPARMILALVALPLSTGTSGLSAGLTTIAE